MAALVLPFLGSAARDPLQPPGAPPFDFRQPRGEPALVAADSVSWRIFRYPIALFIGGVAAVIPEARRAGGSNRKTVSKSLALSLDVWIAALVPAE